MGTHKTVTDARIAIKNMPTDALSHNEYTGCTFEGCDLSGCDMRGASFFDCTFAACNISNANVEGTRFCDCRFDACKLMGLRFEKTNQFLFSIAVVNSTVRLCTFTGMNLDGMILTDSIVEDCDFSSASLKGANFSGSSLPGTAFYGTDISKADFRTASAYAINPTTNTITGATFSCPEALSLLDYLDIHICIACPAEKER